MCLTLWEQYTSLLVAAISTAAFAINPIKIIVNGQEIKPDVPPQIVDGRTVVPIRNVAEALGADVQWDNQNMAVIITSTKGNEKLDVDLISNYLREANTPKQFVENFARALQSRNGAVVRLFLAPEIREQIKPELIGTSTPIRNIEINEATASGNNYRYKIKAYYGPNGNQPTALAFEMNLTVEPETNGSLVPGRYFIKNITYEKILLVGEDINFRRIASSYTWNKTTRQPRPELLDLYKKNYFIITGNSEGSKIFETVGIEKLEGVDGEGPKDIGVNILSLYSDIVSVKKAQEEVIIQVKNKNAGYDYIYLDPSNIPTKQLPSGNKEANFVFIDEQGNVLDKITYSLL